MESLPTLQTGKRGTSWEHKLREEGPLIKPMVGAALWEIEKKPSRSNELARRAGEFHGKGEEGNTGLFRTVSRRPSDPEASYLAEKCGLSRKKGFQ